MIEIKGYPVESGYMGYADGKYRLFSCERDYLDYLKAEREEIERSEEDAE